MNELNELKEELQVLIGLLNDPMIYAAKQRALEKAINRTRLEIARLESPYRSIDERLYSAFS